jgi:branched-chain amino acid transport system substrate-binding protein
MKSRTRRTFTALAIALLMPAAQAQISDNVVKIGVLTDLSGAYSDLGGKGSVIAAQMAIDDFGGKVKGKPIQMVSADHQNKPDVGSAIANRWIDVEQVDMIVDVPTSSVALAIEDITRAKNRVFLDSGAGSSRLTGDKCSPTMVHWTYDTYALANVAGVALTKQGDDSWFFITADYAFGHDLQNDAEQAIKGAGGKIMGAVNAPFPTTDFSSFLLQAQASRAKVVGLANAGQDTVNAIKQAHEFGLDKSGQKLTGLLTVISDVHSLGLETAQGLVLTDGWYWDANDESRAWAKRWSAIMGGGRMPTDTHAGVYSAVMHYLKAIDKAGTDEAKTVVDTMKAMPINDMFAKNGHIRVDGRMVHDMYLVQVKKPSESKYPWDYYTILRTVPGDEAFRPLDKGNCPLVVKK